MSTKDDNLIDFSDSSHDDEGWETADESEPDRGPEPQSRASTGEQGDPDQIPEGSENDGDSWLRNYLSGPKMGPLSESSMKSYARAAIGLRQQLADIVMYTNKHAQENNLTNLATQSARLLQSVQASRPEGDLELGATEEELDRWRGALSNAALEPLTKWSPDTEIHAGLKRADKDVSGIESILDDLSAGQRRNKTLYDVLASESLPWVPSDDLTSYGWSYHSEKERRIKWEEEPEKHEAALDRISVCALHLKDGDKSLAPGIHICVEALKEEVASSQQSAIKSAVET